MKLVEPENAISVTVIMPVMDEVMSQQETLNALERDFASQLNLIIVVCQKTSQQSLEVAKKFSESRVGVEILWQSRPFLGGAIQDAVENIKTTHYLVMASDCETNPSDAIKLWETAQRNPLAIVIASRWLNPKSFSRYGKSRLLANWFFQKILTIMWRQPITDFTFGFRVVPMRFAQKINPTSLKHEYFLESLLLMLNLGAKVIEIPTIWKARNEGVSHNVFKRNVVYLVKALHIKMKFSNKVNIGE